MTEEEKESLKNIGCFGVGNEEPREEIWSIAEKDDLTDREKILLKHLLWLSDTRNFNEYKYIIHSNILYSLKLITNSDLCHMKDCSKNVSLSAQFARDVEKLIYKTHQQEEKW